MIEPNEQEEELENCCPLCGGKISSVLDDFMELEEIKKRFYNNYSYKVKFRANYKTLKLKLKMIEMGLIPK